MSFNNSEWLDYHEDVEIDIETVAADRGGVAAGDDITDSAVNTGLFAGIQNGAGDVDAQHATIGDGNVTLTGSAVGAVAFGGSATNVEADGNANLGSGTLNDIDAENVNYGSGTLIDVASNGGQTVVGSGNELTGDVDVAMGDVSGNANLAIGDENEQVAVQDNDVTIDESYTDNSVDTYTEDNSTNDSFNQLYADSFNQAYDLTSVEEDNDVTLDNDTETYNTSVDYAEEHSNVEAWLWDVHGSDVDIHD